MTPPPHFDEPQHNIAESVLTSAIIAAERGILTNDTAATIVSYLTASIDFFLFLHDFSLCRPDTQKIEADHAESIDNLFADIEVFRTSAFFAEKIKSLSFNEFMSFINKLSQTDGLRIHKTCGPPILIRLYEDNVLSKPTFFALMLRYLRAPSVLSNLIGTISDGGPFGFMSLLGSFLGEGNGDDDGEEPDEDESEDDSDENHDGECGCCGGCCGECHGGCGGCGHCGTSDNK